MKPSEPLATCVNFVPGEVLAIRRRYEKDEAVGSRFELGETVELIVLGAPAEGYQTVLERIAVPIGLEQRFIQLLSRQENVQAVSLNYLGRSASAAVTQQNVRSDRNIAWLIQSSSSAPTSSEQVPQIQSTSPLIVVVDVRADHCMSVVDTAYKAASTYGPTKVTVLGVFAPVRATTFGLYEYLAIVAELTKLARCPDAIVMSVDFGIACLEPDQVGGQNPIEGTGSVATYSFPLFETALQEIMSTCMKRPAFFGRLGTPCLPAIFAAAGNRDYKAGLRQRLAYPALRPEIVAVTHVTGDDGAASHEPNNTSDLPLCHDLKPIFAVPEEIPRSHHARVDGTSFAAPWCAGWYTALREGNREDEQLQEQLRRPLARMATLQGICDRAFEYGNIRHLHQETPISLLPWKVSTRPQRLPRGERSLTEASKILRDMNAKFQKWEFAVTGSTTAILAGCPDPADLQGAVVPGDIDMAYAGDDPPNRAEHEEIVTHASGAFEALFQRSIPRIELTSIEGRVAPFALFQCIIPAGAMFLTAGGLLDSWHGQDDIQLGEISIRQPIGGLPFIHPHAASEQYARLASYLVAMTLVCRLQSSWMHHRKGKLPDFDRDYSHGLSRALEEDGLESMTPRMETRLAKLSDELARHSQQVHPGRYPQYLCAALSVLRRKARVGAGLDSTFGRFVGHSGTYLAMYSP